MLLNDCLKLRQHTLRRTKMSEQVKITKKDLTEGKYVFASDVVVRKQEGVSPTGTKTKEPDCVFTVDYGFGGLALSDVLDNSMYKLGVNFRSSVRSHEYFPDEVTIVGVGAKTGRMQMNDLPAKQQALAIFSKSKFPDEDQRQACIAAFLATQK